ncbi:uncharacterized protein [Venturia canescens]|uniref:uncharacterized protein isoform X2 n=1 Tax=Venturia canescens TaxID=32260 RepID=UPI001C9BCF16|nr:uncharacterized protein LOC122408809 isoform X2 [Venturia canescens]
MSSSSSNNYYESDDDNDSWVVFSDDSTDEDELTLLNGDEENDEDSTKFEAFIRLSMRLKKQYNLQEASVALERCDKIWDTMQLLKNAQSSYNSVEEEEVYTDQGKVSSSVPTETVPYIKYQPTQGNGNNALPNFYLSVKKQTKIYNCGTCGRIYNEKRAFKIHMKRDHGIALPGSPQIRKRSNNSETRPGRPKTPQSTDASSVDGDKGPRTRRSTKKNPESATDVCPICGNLYFSKQSMLRHAQDVHGIDTQINSKKLLEDDGESNEPAIPTTSIEKTSVKNENERTKRTCRLGVNYIYTRARISNLDRYIYFCIICQKEFDEKRDLRNHMSSKHEIDIPKGPKERLYGLFIKDYESSRKYLQRVSRHEEIKESPLKPYVQRARATYSKKLERPKRACAMNTSYNELTKEEEEILLCERVSRETKYQQPASSHTTKCFLCKRSCADIIHHLKDYHRINEPKSVLPLSEKLSNDQIHDEVETMESEEMKEKNKSLSKKIPSNKQISPNKTSSPEQLNNSELIDKTLIQGFYKKLKSNTKDGKTAICLMCKARFTKMSGLEKHLATYMKDGVIQEHASPSSKFAQEKLSTSIHNEGMSEDPLKLDDAPSVHSDNSSVKRESSSDESSSTSDETPLSKRRKIESAKASEDIDRLDTGSEESEEETAKRKSKNIFRNNRAEELNEDGDKNESLDQQDTRNSSDRDSVRNEESINHQ